MQRQMETGLKDVEHLLTTAFDPSPDYQTLADFFSPHKFKSELNNKFQVIHIYTFIVKETL